MEETIIVDMEIIMSIYIMGDKYDEDIGGGSRIHR
jgi:hypothetical protein